MPPRRRLSWRLLPLLVLLLLALAWALASLDWCGPWAGRSPRELARARGQGPLQAGAARVPLQPPLPVGAGAGYPPPLATVEASALPLQARALVLQAGTVRVGLVSLELLSAPASVVEGVRARVAGLGLTGVLVVATHTHSAFGGYDPRPVAQVAGMGRFHEPLLEVAVAAAAQALTRAAGQLEPVRLELAEAAAPERVRSRSGEQAPEGRLLRAAFLGARGPVAELLLFSAHPTLVPRPVRALDPDYPGRLSRLREEGGAAQVSLVLQGAAGNAAAVPEGEPAPDARAESYARTLAQLAARAAGAAAPVESLAFARVQVSLPRPDASRLVPGLLEDAGETLLCGSSAEVAEVSALAVGPLRLLGVPGEPTVAAGARLAGAAGAAAGTPQVLGLADGYLGYVETPEAVAAGRGEARRQYFGPALLEQLSAGARAAAQAAGF